MKDKDDRRSPEDTHVSEEKERKAKDFAADYNVLDSWNTQLADDWCIDSDSMLTESNARQSAEKLMESLSRAVGAETGEALKTEAHLKPQARPTETPSTRASPANPKAKRITVDSLEMDNTADFATSTNPFRQTTDVALKEIAVAESTPEATLSWLSDSSDSEIRKSVASNSSCPEKLLRKLSRDANGSVRLAVLDNPAVSSRIVVDLLSDANPLVSLRAFNLLDDIRRKAGLAPLKQSPVNTVKDLPSLKSGGATGEPPVSASQAMEAIEFLKMIARRHSTPTKRLLELSRHPSSVVRAAVALNARAPVDILWTLANDREPSVKRQLVRNNNCPLEVLEALKKDADTSVASAAVAEIDRINSGLC